MTEEYEELRTDETVSFGEFVESVKLHLQGLTRYVERYIYESAPDQYKFFDTFWSDMVLHFDKAIREYRLEVASLEDSSLKPLEDTINEIIKIMGELQTQSFPSMEEAKNTYLDLIRELMRLETYDLSVVEMAFENPKKLK